MSLTNRVGLLAGFATLALSGAVFAQTHDASSQALTEIAKLKAELAEIKSQQGDNWLTEQRASEIRSLVQDVLADADTRASLQSSGMTAGWDKGFFLASPDGNFKLRVKGQIQFRYVYNYRDINTDLGDRYTKGFENRRTKLTFEGNIFDKTWLYKVQAAFNRGVLDDDGQTASDSGAAQLEDAWIQKDFENGMYLRMGQYKPPFLREELVSSSRQLLIERSLLNERYNQDYSQGISLGYETDMFRLEGMFSDGIGDRNAWGPSYQNSPWQQTTTEYALTARGEFKVAGEWSQFDDFTSWSGEPFGLMIGAAANWQRQEDGTNGPASGQQLGATVDVSAEFGGANLYGAFIWVNPDIDDNAGNDRNEIGFLVQGGFMIVPDTFEIFARYEWSDPDQDTQDDLNMITAGANWYFAKHAAKLSVDFGFSLEDFDSDYANSGAGWLVGFNEFQLVARAQFQLLF
jgi:hypothetical protein